jgi:hypothetical protein
MSLVSPLPLPEGGTFYLKTTTLLGDSWLNTFPELTQLRRELGFSFQTKAPWISRSLWQAGPEASTRLTVYAHDGWLLLFPQLLAKPQLDLSKAWFLCLSLFFLSVSYLLLSLKKRQESLDSTLQKLREWSTELGTEPSDKSLDQNPLESLKTAMSRLVKRNLENQARLEHQAKLLQQQIVKLESRVIEQQAEQAWFQHTQSLHQQMQACAEAYIAKLQESISLGEDLSYVASREIFKPAQRLFDLSSRWDMELSKHSPKKFLRTLTERVNEQGSSELEDSLDRLIQDSHNVGNCAINLSMLSQKLNQELKATLSLAQHWQSMMHNGSRDQQSLLGILQESQTLIKLRGEALPLSYDNLMGGEARLEGIEIPTSTVTSVLYHAHLALIETALDKGARQLHLSTHIKKRKDRHILVVSLRSEGQDQLEPGSDLPAKASQHLSLAIQLLQGYAMKITSLPPLPGVYALALIWHPECPSEIPPLGVDLRLDNSSSFSHMDEMEKL